MAYLRKPSWKANFPNSARIVFAMMVREMATSYGRSAAGYLWAIAEPIGAIAILSLVFSVAFANPALGASFPLFYATGYIPFMLYNAVQSKVSGAVRENLALLFYPRVTYVDAFLARFILNTLTQILVALIVFWGIFELDGINQRIDLVAILIALLMAAVLGLGIGVLNCVIIHLMPSWLQIWSIINRPLFLVSCIFYMFDTLPSWVQDILWFNPLVHIIGQTRTGFYTSYGGDYISPGYVIFVSGSTLFLGLLLMRRYSSDLINN